MKTESSTDRSEFADEFGKEIAAALEPFAAEPESFDAGIQQRLKRSEDRDSSNAPWIVRYAASILPPTLLPLSLAKTGMAATGVVTKQAAWKFLPGVLALPAAVALMLFATFAVGLGSSKVRGRQQDANVFDVSREVTGWWKRNAALASVAVLALLAIGIWAPIESFLLFFGLSMLAVVGIIGALARAGYATRAEVGACCGSFLMMIPPYAFGFIGLLAQRHPYQFVPMTLTAVIFGVAAAICMSFSGVRHNARNVSRLFGAAIVIGIGLLLLALPIHRTRMDRDAAIDLVERHNAFGEYSDWKAMAATINHLRADGGRAPRLDDAMQRFHQAIDAERAEDPDTNPLFVRELEALEFFREVDYAAFRSPRSARMIIEGKRPMISANHDIFTLAVYEHFEDLTKKEQAHIAKRVVAGTLDRPYVDLDDLELRARLLENLGHAERIEQLRGLVSQRLREHWTGYPGADRACFVSSPNSIERDSNGTPLPMRLSFIWMDETDWAVRLLARFGVPEGIDLHALDGYLRDMSFQYRHMSDTAALAVAMRGRIATFPGFDPIPEDTFFAWLHRMRLACGAALLGLFCVMITMRTPRAGALAS